MKILRAIPIAIFILVNLASAWLVPLIYVDFELRQDYIAEVLCIERDQPITVCKGSCYLTVQLGKAVEQQEKEKEVSPTEVVFFFQRSAIELPANTPDHFTATYYPAFEDQKQSNPHLTGIFHPPRS